MSSEPLESYGIDSIMIMQLNRRLAEGFGELSKTLFFEYPTLAGVAELSGGRAWRGMRALDGAGCGACGGQGGQQAGDEGSPLGRGVQQCRPAARRCWRWTWFRRRRCASRSRSSG